MKLIRLYKKNDEKVISEKTNKSVSDVPVECDRSRTDEVTRVTEVEAPKKMMEDQWDRQKDGKPKPLTQERPGDLRDKGDKLSKRMT